jgi:uncharacterized protein
MKSLRINGGGLVLLLTLFLAVPLGAQLPRTATSARHSLWKVEGDHCAVYLLGSIHVLKAENYPLPAEFEAAYTNSAAVVFETDIDEMEQLPTQVKLLSKARMPAGETLSQDLSPAVYTRFTNHLNEVGLPLVMFDMFKPAMAAMTLEVLEMQKLGLDPEFGLDKHFFARARKDAKKIIPLETVDFQISLVTDFSKEEGDLLMKSTLEDIDTVTRDLQDLLKAWQTGDADSLEKLLNGASREAPAIYKRLVSDRNARWVPKIEEMLKSGGRTNTIVIVGAGHLVGKDGVVELLRKQGFKVTQQ